MGIKGAILGDIAGSRFEKYPNFRYEYDSSSLKDKNLNEENEYSIFTDTCRFTDDTVMSIATMKAFHSDKDYAKAYRDMYSRYPNVGYGKAFNKWAQDPNEKAYKSFGNGSAMRAGYIGEAMRENPFKFMVELEARRSAMVSHNHPEGIKGSVTAAVCVWMAERGKSKKDIQRYLYKQYPDKKYETKQFEDLTTTEEKRDAIRFSSKCQDTVPFAIHCFLQTESFFDCMNLINSMECDTDTIGAIAGAVCDSYYNKCTEIDNEIIKAYLTQDLQKDLESCGINISVAKSQEWVKFHDDLEERYYLETMELAAMEDATMGAFITTDIEQNPWEGYECDGQITFDDYFPSLENSETVKDEILEDDYYNMLAEEIKEFEDYSSDTEMMVEILDAIENDGNLITSTVEDFDLGD